MKFKSFAFWPALAALALTTASARAQSFSHWCAKRGETPQLKLTVRLLLNAAKTDRCEEAESILKSRKSLDLSNKSITRYEFPATLPKLDLRPIEELTELEELDLGFRGVNDYAPLARLKGLRALRLTGVHDGETFILSSEDCKKSVSELINLERLDLRLSGTVDTECLAPLSKLQDFDLSYNDLSAPGILEGLKELRSLQTLKLRWSELSDSHLASLGALESLKFLDLSQNNLSGGSFNQLRRLRELRHLNLEFNAISDAGLRQLSDLRDLEHLYFLQLSGNYLKGSSLAALAVFPHLALLSLEFNELEDALFSNIEELAKGPLFWLKIGGNHLTSKSVGSITKLKNLRILAIEHSLGFVNKDVASLTLMPNLTWLAASNTLIEKNEPVTKRFEESVPGRRLIDEGATSEDIIQGLLEQFQSYKKASATAKNLMPRIRKQMARMEQLHAYAQGDRTRIVGQRRPDPEACKRATEILRIFHSNRETLNRVSNQVEVTALSLVGGDLIEDDGNFASAANPELSKAIADFIVGKEEIRHKGDVLGCAAQCESAARKSMSLWEKLKSLFSSTPPFGANCQASCQKKIPMNKEQLASARNSWSVYLNEHAANMSSNYPVMTKRLRITPSEYFGHFARLKAFRESYSEEILDAARAVKFACEPIRSGED